MNIICITQRPIQTLILIYLLAKKNIFFEKVIYCSLKNKNFRDEGAISWKALEYQCNLLKIPFYKILDINKDLLKIKSIKSSYVISLVVDTIISSKVIGYFNGHIYSSHGGILPKYRGVDCTSWSIINGEKYVGITLQKMSKGVDDGKIFKTSKIKVKQCNDLKSIEKLLYYKYKLFDFVNLITQIKKKKKLKYLKVKKSEKQYFKMHKDLVKIVEKKLK